MARVNPCLTSRLLQPCRLFLLRIDAIAATEMTVLQKMLDFLYENRVHQLRLWNPNTDLTRGNPVWCIPARNVG